MILIKLAETNLIVIYIFFFVLSSLFFISLFLLPLKVVTRKPAERCDDSKSQFNVFCYNIQHNVSTDYAMGYSDFSQYAFIAELLKNGKEPLKGCYSEKTGKPMIALPYRATQAVDLRTLRLSLEIIKNDDVTEI